MLCLPHSCHPSGKNTLTQTLNPFRAGDGGERHDTDRRAGRDLGRQVSEQGVKCGVQLCDPLFSLHSGGAAAQTLHPCTPLDGTSPAEAAGEPTALPGPNLRGSFGDEGPSLMESKGIIPEEDEGPSLKNCSENKETFPEGRFWGIRGKCPEEKHEGAKGAMAEEQFWGIRE